MPSLKDTCRNASISDVNKWINHKLRHLRYDDIIVLSYFSLPPRRKTKRVHTVLKVTDCDQPKMYLIQQFSICFEIN